MPNPSPDSSNFGGEATAIVRTLREYKSIRPALPIDFVARQVGRRPKELQESLEQLENKGVIRIDAAKGEVALLPES